MNRIWTTIVLENIIEQDVDNNRTKKRYLKNVQYERDGQIVSKLRL